MASFAAGSGVRSTAGVGVSAGSEAPWVGVQRSKSVVSNAIPVRGRAYSRAPSGEYHTVSTGPVAGAANPTFIAGLPTRRHSTGAVCAARIPAAPADNTAPK